MANEVTKANNTALATSNPFLDFGQQASQSSIVGKLLKFSKGDWTAGQDGDEVPLGTGFIANMDDLTAGWIRWEDNKPTDQIMGKVSEGYQPPRRSDLGDNVKEDWPVDNDGKPRDPWQLSNYLPLKGLEDGELYTFPASSKGSLTAIGELCKAYGKTMAQRPHEFPIVSIGQDSYQHPNRSLGRIKFPVFTVTGWAPKTVFDDIVAGGGDDEIPFDEPAKPAQSAASKMIRKAGRI
jgi:hypothetical protein